MSDKWVLEPVLDILQLLHGDRVHLRHWLLQVLKDKHKIKILQAELHTFQMGQLNIGQRHDKEGGFRDGHQTFRGGL